MSKYSLLGLGCPDSDCGCDTSLSAAPATITIKSEPNSDWGCPEWMIWHQTLVKGFMAGQFASGIKYNEADATFNANKIFAQWWPKAASWTIKNIKGGCGYDTDFYRYFKKIGLTDHMSIISGILTPLFAGATDVASSAGDVASNIAKTAGNTSKILEWLVPVVLIGGVTISGIYVYNRFIKEKKK